MRGDDPITVSEAARIAEVSEDTIRRWESTGSLAARRTSTGVRIFRRGDVEQWAADRKQRRAAHSA